MVHLVSLDNCKSIGISQMHPFLSLLVPWTGSKNLIDILLSLICINKKGENVNLQLIMLFWGLNLVGALIWVWNWEVVKGKPVRTVCTGCTLGERSAKEKGLGYLSPRWQSKQTTAQKMPQLTNLGKCHSTGTEWYCFQLLRLKPPKLVSFDG